MPYWVKPGLLTLLFVEGVEQVMVPVAGLVDQRSDFLMKLFDIGVIGRVHPVQVAEPQKIQKLVLRLQALLFPALEAWSV